MKLGVIVAAFALAALGLTTKASAGSAKTAKYLGPRACMPCHRTAAQGKMWSIWQNSKHANAYDTLASAQAKKVAARVGVTDPQNDPKCLECHVTAYGVPATQKSHRFKDSDGVTCEACHGAGSLYKRKRTMCEVTAGEITPESVGLVIPNEQTCVRCHNDKSPTWSGSFNFKEMSQKIAHKIPAARKQKIKDKGCTRAKKRS